MDIGGAIKATRMERTMKQKDLADSCGLSRNHLSMIEHGKRGARKEQLERIAIVLGVSPGYLYVRALDRNDFPKSKRQLFESLRPVLQGMLEQLG